MTQPERSGPPLAEPESRVGLARAEHGASPDAASVPMCFLAQLAMFTDGIGFVHVLDALERHGVLAELARVGAAGARLGDVARVSGANLGYLAVVLRALSAQGWAWRELDRAAAGVRVGMRPEGRALLHLFRATDAAAQIVRFAPVARNMSAYLGGAYEPEAGAPGLELLVERSRRDWDLPSATNEREREVRERLAAAFDGNLVGPIAVALHESFGVGPSGGSLSFDVRSERWSAAADLLQHAGWVERRGAQAHATELGAYALRRALAFGVPISYLPLFAGVDALLFGDAELFWARGPDEPERHVERGLNVRASGASHQRYFAAADALIRRAFDQPLEAQPRGFCDMGSGDGAWLEHVWQLVLTQTERGRLIQRHPHDERFQLVLVGADFNDAARSATRARLTRAGVPHVVMFGDVNDPRRLAQDLAARGIDSRELLHGSSFLVHNRPYSGVRDLGAARRRRGVSAGAYAWRGQAVPNAELEQNLVEFFAEWRHVIGAHGMISIELHDPESVVAGKTLTNYMLTHGLSDQFTVGIGTFLAAAAEAGLALDPTQHRIYPEPRALATISVSHFRPAP